MSRGARPQPRGAARRDDRGHRLQAHRREADVVETALFLCSSAANNLTGQDINVSAGAVMY